jgi:hypothetical protein
MLGEGIVSFGRFEVTEFCRKRKSSPKMVSETPSLPTTCSAGRRPLDVAVLVVEGDRDVAGFLRDAVQLVNEVHVPGGAAELTVRR